MGYKEGRAFEYEVQKYLREKDWVVNRAYASKGLFDLLAYQGGIRWGIQCKSLSANSNRAYLPKKEDVALKDYYENPKVPYQFVSWNKKYRMPLLQLLEESFVVIHAYNMFPEIGWRMLINGQWCSFSV